MLNDYDLTVYAVPDKPDEFVLVPAGHPAMRELSEAGVKPCGVEIVEQGILPAHYFFRPGESERDAVSAGRQATVRRYLFWWADWHRIAEGQRSSGG